MNIVFLNLLQVLALLPIFLFLSVLVFYVPGYLLLNRSKRKFRDDELITLSFGLGLVLFLIIAVFTAVIQARFLSLLIFLLINLYAFFRFKTRIFSPFLKLFKQKALMALLILGTMVEGFINFPSSFPFKIGHFYWSSQGHDGLWHIAAIETIKKSFPPANPLYAGQRLYNYHYFIDVIIAEFNRLFSFFSSLDLYFRFFSFLISFLMGLAAYSLLTTWKKNKTIGYLGIFFTYLVGSFGYLVLLIQGRGFFGGETVFWAAQGNTIIGNPPHAFCYVLIPTFFLAFYHFLKKRNIPLFLACFLLGGFLVGFKVSAGFVLLAGMGVASLFSLWLKRKREIFLLTLALGLTNLTVFKSITKGGEALLMFHPWWFIRTMIVVSERANWIDLELRRQFYLAQGGVRGYLRVVQFEALAFLVFLVGNLGTRIIGFWEIFKSLYRRTLFTDPLEASLFFTMLTGFLMPLFFVQKGVTYNLIQFMQYFLLIFGFWGAIGLYHLLHSFKEKPKKYLVMGIVVFLSIPTVIGNLKEFYGKNALAIVTYEEISALNFLKNASQKDDVFLTMPFNPYSRGLYEKQPWPIYAWESTAYVSAYTGRPSYYTDEGQVRIFGIDTEERLEKMNDFFDTELSVDKKREYLEGGKFDLEKKKEFLEKENIKFIYLRQEETDEVQKEIFSQLGLKEIFRNEKVVIYRVD